MGEEVSSRDPSFFQTVFDIIQFDAPSSMMHQWMVIFRMVTGILKETVDGSCIIAFSK